MGIERYPIYFFTDEAIHMNMADDFIHNNFQNYDHEFLPAFFRRENWVNGVSVYVQILPYLLFGKSVLVTRLVSAAITLAGAFALGLLLKQAFKNKYYWVIVFFLLTTPAWFLHARTAFEYAELASFYSMFLYFYSRYRIDNPSSLFAAIFCGALVFYTHGLGQILMGVTALALFMIDFRYHLHPDRKTIFMRGLILGLILFMPFARYYVAHSTEALAQLERRNSYWTNDNLTILQKMGEFIGQYLYGLNPLYWYFPNSVDIERHIMKDYGNGLVMTLPFALIGFIRSIKNIRHPQYRIVLISFLAAPIPASVVAIGMPRMLWMAIPLAIFSSLGLSYCIDQFELRRKKPVFLLSPVIFISFIFLSLFMLRDALTNGLVWSQEYGLYGMQYGARQVFQETVLPDLETNSERVYIISPSWANGAETFVDFFIPEGLRSRVNLGQPINLIMLPSSNAGGPNLVVTFGNEEHLIPLPLPAISFTSNIRFVVTPNEYDLLLKDPKFKDIVIYKIISWPNGQPGFYVLSLSAVDNVREILTAEGEKNRAPVEDFIQVGAQQIRVLHSPFASGNLDAVFDQDSDSLAQVLQANPLTFELFPGIPMETHRLILQTGSLPDFTLTVSLYAPGKTEPVIYTQTFKGLPSDPIVHMDFDKGPSRSDRIYIEIKDNLTGETSEIHVRTIDFK